MSSSSRRPSSPCVSDIIHSTLSFTPCALLSSKKARVGVLASVHAVSTCVRVLIILEDISSPCCKYVGWPLGCWIALYFIAACMVKVDECSLWVAVCKIAPTGAYVFVMSHLYAHLASRFGDLDYAGVRLYFARRCRVRSECFTQYAIHHVWLKSMSIPRARDLHH